MFKKIILNLILVVIFFFLFQITAHSLPGQVFEDLKESDIYYEDVMYFIGQGVISGREDGLFHPEDLITTAEVITITEKVLGDKENLPDNWGWWENPEYNNPNIKTWEHDWNFPGTLIKDGYTSPASRNTVSCILLNIAKQPLVNTEPWGIEMRGWVETVFYYNNMLIRGFWNGEESHFGVTRAEFCHVLRRFLNNQELLKPTKDIFIEIKQRYEGEKTETEQIEDYYRLYSLILKIPENIQKLYTKKGYDFYYVDDAYWNRYLSDIDYAGGVYDHSRYRRRIIIRQQDERTVLHEFAHFIEDYYYEYFSRTKKIYNEDKKEENHKLMLLTKNTYCNTSSQEYFADGFSVYITEPEKLKKELPELYEIYEKLMREINSLEI